MDVRELTNVPDYQKILQTGFAANRLSKDWIEEVETLIPSPVIQHPEPSQRNSFMVMHNDPYAQDSFPTAAWQSKEPMNGAETKVSLGFNKFISDSQPHYRASKYDSKIFLKEEIPQRSTHSLIPYVDINNSEHKNARRKNSHRPYTNDSSGYTENQQSNYLQRKDINTSYLKAPQDDLRSWQQQHQEELLHQHLETQALYDSTTSQTTHSMLEPVFGQLHFEETPSQWEPVRRAADNIIKEKNMIIDKLKNRILELEEDYNVLETNFKQALRTKEDEADLMKKKLQELQHKTISMKEQMIEASSKQMTEVDDLEMKLGACEHQLQQMRTELQTKDTLTSELQTQLTEKTEKAKAWKAKFLECCNSHHDMKKKLDGLQHYFDELPTLEESRIQAQELLSLKAERYSMNTRSENLEKKLTQVRKIITARDMRIRELEEREKQLRLEVESTQSQAQSLSDPGKENDLLEIKAEKERLERDLEKAKKLIETTHLKVRTTELKYQAELRLSQERLTQEQEMVSSLKTEVSTKEEQIERMKKSMKELGIQNQNLLRKSLQTQEQLRLVEVKDTPASAELHQFMLQLSVCFSQLKSLVQICTQRIHGEDPDLSLLLGVEAYKSEQNPRTTSTDSKAQSTQGMQINQWLLTLGDLRKEMDRMRAFICNRYAEDIGDNMTCATQ